MSNIAVKNSVCSGHGGFPSRPPAEAVEFVKVNGIGVLVDGNAYPAHTDGNSSHPGNAVSTRPWFTIGGKPVVCEGDPVSCGSTVTSGDPLVKVG
ncbi:alanine racemase [Salmonella enterica subsp. enterica serovar Typhimurium]|uniref:PAAR domain-containing protein n=1 Tax=Citrobacter TaxID=544 RepID=UPI00127FD553|nr:MULTISPECIES: PAAR domain-containing protein [Citrobacter freundii complex]EBZ5074336.1 alanine racemase [Salmonella enterica subsp. enterica serovar Typhimurium]EDW6206100.1 alanine racemase [Salmonella enterica subsp. enterica]EEB8458282.1 alanine racemase [Salmonella enterica]EGT5658443.1 alanine racemase [Citrobacter braakii]ECL7522421.1 alanine racemase [Salmonella enterica subsp. enterica serovar Typhimurium]